MKSVIRLFLLFLTTVVVAHVQADLSDCESFLNTISLVDKNKDYDRDGATENVNHEAEICKDIQIVFVSPVKVTGLVVSLPSFFLRLIPVDHITLALQDFSPQIFRPPIFA